MHYTKISGAAVLLALAPSALALGSATLVNSCGFDIYYAPTGASFETMQAMPPGGSYTAVYSDEGLGTSIKVAATDDIAGPVTQFEFTWSAGKINYDISNINGNPFSTNGMSLTPSMQNDPSNPTCTQVDCPAVQDGGDSVCQSAYNNPNDVETKVCSEDASLTMVICSGGAKLKREPELAHSEPAILHSHHRIHTRHFPKK